MSHSEFEALLNAWLAGTISAEQEEQLHEMTQNDAEYAKAFSAATEEFAALAMALEPVAPSTDLRDKLIAEVKETNRFEDLAQRVSELIDRDLEFTTRLVGNIDTPSNWESSPFPGVELFHIDGGPAVEDAIVGFVRIQPGGVFPDHLHCGKEYKLVLQGGFREDSGQVYRRGELCESDPDTHHNLSALPDGPPLIYLVVLHTGLEVAGMFIGPDDARM